MSQDRIFAEMGAKAGSFEFNDEVADVFPDMLRRSIPGYAASIEAIGTLASRYVQPGSRCYDLGCSLGAATLAMQQNISVRGCQIIAIDLAPAMIRRCREFIAASDSNVDVSIIEDDVRQITIEQASMVVMNYTLQFLSLAERDAMIGNIFDGLNEGGIFVLSEKVLDEDEEVEKLLVEMHHEFKRRNAYSDLEISRKRTALENVLIPETIATHRTRLGNAGFRHVGICLRQFNFVSIIATK
ncbi:MAG: carboxy-S-adenosyl-L-methionine synthase CmoA [Proteobacteria bacterium]|nr:carboxy-S-adenosyl-L-methionine synthase CmoA [Pseudomonadota bacterium]TDJ36454.1 MAG: carboxy-S-adenosyl-L-methionine synthase CmoA [Gammaproteobacteria bacterium]